MVFYDYMKFLFIFMLNKNKCNLYYHCDILYYSIGVIMTHQDSKLRCFELPVDDDDRYHE